MLYPCVVSPEKKRNIKNDLAILPSHNKYPKYLKVISINQAIRQLVGNLYGTIY